MNRKQILFTGGTGLLGSNMKKMFTDALFPTHQELDVSSYSQVIRYFADKEIQTLVHAAAFTSPPKVDTNPIEAINSNIIGTSNITKLCIERNMRLVYISTDYVFRGDRGEYSEEDAVFPVNKYAWSKLGGECAVQLCPNSLIIRTSFGSDIFPYESAFADQYTSRVGVSDLTTKLLPIIEDQNLKGIIHIGANRRTVIDFARRLDPSRKIGEMSIGDVNFNVPVDTSLNCSKYNKWLQESSNK